jgi:hypothetical protein
MSADAKKNYGSTVVLMILGMLALYGGDRCLLGLIPAAMVVWYAAARPVFSRTKEWTIMDEDVRRIHDAAVTTANRAERAITL